MGMGDQTPHLNVNVLQKGKLLDPNHHVEDWTFFANGQTSTQRFEFHRKQ
jgi:hypothetical protein